MSVIYASLAYMGVTSQAVLAEIIMVEKFYPWSVSIISDLLVKYC